jgi:hypothetical protein
VNQTNFFDAFDNARLRMEARFKLGAEQEQFLLAIVTATVIVDRLVPPRAMTFLTGTGDRSRELYIHYKETEGGYAINRHALNQLCSKVQLGMNYVNMLQAGAAWKHDLLCDNLNALFQTPDWTDRGGQPQRFLHRIVGRELRGFLSRRFNRHLASAPLLRAFIDQCKTEGARPVEAANSPVRSALKCLMPKVFEAFPGEYICLGVEWSNSDFGSGKLKVLQTCWRVGSGTAAVVDEGLRRAHIGSIIEDSDIEMSDETAKKELEAQQGAVRDHVKAYLSEKTVERMLTAIRAAAGEQIPWSQLSHRLRDVLGKGDLEWLKNVLDQKAETIIDLPPISFDPGGNRVPNLYWAAGGLSAIAARTDDPDKRLDLQREAGKLLASAMED